MSLADLTRNWVLRQLGISQSNLSETDLLTQLYNDKTAPVQSEAMMPYRAGFWGVPPHSTQTTGAMAVNTARGMPFIPGRNMQIQSLAIDVTVAGTAGCVIRLGIYRDLDDGSGTLELLVDAGTVLGDAVATPTKAITPVDLIAGQLYWIVASSQGAPAAEPTVRIGIGTPIAILASGSPSLPLQNNLCGIAMPPATGPFPATVTKQYTTAPYKVAFQVV